MVTVTIVTVTAGILPKNPFSKKKHQSVVRFCDHRITKWWVFGGCLVGVEATPTPLTFLVNKGILSVFLTFLVGGDEKFSLSAKIWN